MGRVMRMKRDSLRIVFIVLFLFFVVNLQGVKSVPLVRIQIGGVPIVEIPSDAIIDMKDEASGPRIAELYEMGKLLVFYGEASTPSPFPEEGYKKAREEAFIRIAQYVELRAKVAESKVSATVSSPLLSRTQSLMKRIISISTDTNFGGAKDILRYRLKRSGELARYVVVVLFDPEELLNTIKMSKEYLEMEKQARAMGEAGLEFFQQLNAVLEEALEGM